MTLIIRVFSLFYYLPCEIFTEKFGDIKFFFLSLQRNREKVKLSLINITYLLLTKITEL
jgi:hypothetical protein